MNVVIAALLPFVAFFQAPSTPTFTAKLYANHETVTAGGETELVIEVRCQEDWHVYHPIILETGAPTTITFDAPEGVTFGELRFPTPYRGEQAGIDYLALEGTFRILTTVRVADDVPAGPLPLNVRVYALICKELCVPVEAQAELTLTVGDALSAPMNEKLFEEARAALPAPLAKAPYVEGSSVAVSKETIGIDEPAEIVLTVKVKRGHHIQDPDPGVETLIASHFYVEPLNGIKFEAPIWPEPKVKEMEYFGKVREQSGTFKVRVPFKVIDQEFAGGPVALRTLLTYQCCSDEGVCFPPEAGLEIVRFYVNTPTAPPADAKPLGTLYPIRTELLDEESAAPEVGGTSGAVVAGAAGGPPHSLLWILVLGFAGGFLLNVMPCVFPVISIKIIGFVQQAGEDRARVLKLGLAFCAGIMVWFWIFALLTSVGTIPWQHPPVVIGLAAIIFVFALNLFGVFEVTLPGAAAGKLDEAARQEGYTGAFMKGLLATLLGTACTAPFFATAAAFAATQPRIVGLTIFTSAGLGMSLPYLLLSAFPGWLKSLPRPGNWMVVFKQAMGFVLVGTAVWLLLTVGDLLDARGVVWTLAFFSFLAVAAWLLGKIRPSWDFGPKAATWCAALLIAVFGGWFSFGLMYDWNSAVEANGPGGMMTVRNGEDSAATAERIIAAVSADPWNDHIPWQAWQLGLAEELASRGYTVYVDFTATWCVTCQTNKATAVDIQSTRALMRGNGVIPLKGDYTRSDPAIRDVLLRFGHNSVPLNLIYPAGKPDAPVKLPVLLTPAIVQDALKAAGPSLPIARTARKP